MALLVVQLEALPVAEGGRPAADVHHHIEDRPAGAAHQLGDAGIDLEMHAADDPPA